MPNLGSFQPFKYFSDLLSFSFPSEEEDWNVRSLIVLNVPGALFFFFPVNFFSVVYSSHSLILSIVPSILQFSSSAEFWFWLLYFSVLKFPFVSSLQL